MSYMTDGLGAGCEAARERECPGPDEGDAESGPPDRVEPCCERHFPHLLLGRYPRLIRMMQWVAILSENEAMVTLRTLRDPNRPWYGPKGGLCEAVAHWGRGEADPAKALVKRAFAARHVFPIAVRVRYYRTGVLAY